MSFENFFWARKFVALSKSFKIVVNIESEEIKVRVIGAWMTLVGAPRTNHEREFC